MIQYPAFRCIFNASSIALLLTLILWSDLQITPVSLSQAKPADVKPLTGQSVNFLVAWPHLGAAQALAKWFKEETGAIVKITKVDFEDLLQTIIDNHNRVAPQFDVMMMWYVNLGRLVEDGILYNLDDFYTRHREIMKTDDYIAKILKGYSVYKNRRWSVPFDGDNHVLFYRKSIFAKHQLLPPKTWDQYTKVAKLITEKEKANGIYGSAIMANPTPIMIVSSFMNRLGGYGGVLLDDNLVPMINSPEAVAALTAMVEQSAYALPSPLETDFSVSRDAFLLGQVAMVEQWTDIGIMAEDANQSFIMGDWGAVAMPRGTGPKARQSSSLNAGWTLGISSRAPNREVAEAFLLFMARPDTTLRLNLIPGGGGIDPVRKSVIISPEFRKNAPVISKAEAAILKGDMIVWPNHPKIPALLAILSDCLVAAMEKRQTPETALNACQLKWTAIIQNVAP